MKKCYELSVLCGLSINLIIFDTKLNKMQEYSSKPDFIHEKINELIYPKSIKKKTCLRDRSSTKIATPIKSFMKKIFLKIVRKIGTVIYAMMKLTLVLI